MLRRALDDEGSSPVEFVLVGSLLTILTLAILQLGFAFYVKNLLHDAAVEGAYHAALADVSLQEGAERTELSITRALGDGFAHEVMIAPGQAFGDESVHVTVRATLPVIGLIGIPYGLEVSADAPKESLEP